MLGVIPGGGAVLGVAAALLAGRYALPEWVRPVALGSLAGVAAVVVVSYVLDIASGGLAPKGRVGQVSYRGLGLVCGVPVGLIAGAAAGMAVARRRRIAPPSEAAPGEHASPPPADIRDNGEGNPAGS